MPVRPVTRQASPSTTSPLRRPTGQITVLVGPSGCGKTTTLRMVNRMITPTSGSIWLDGRDTAALDEAELAARHRLRHPARRALPAPHRARQRRHRPATARLGHRQGPPRAAEMLELVGLDAAYGGRYPSQLSGGQQQRVGVARALAADPPVMLMDEPFSAVDPVVREQLQDEFLRLQRELGKTILFVTHDIDEAIKLGDQVAVLRVGGRLAQLDTPARLLADPVDDFVADFVGRDRGYRALGFRGAPPLALRDEPTVRLGAGVGAARAATTDRWLLVLDDAGAPVGWVEPDRLTGPIGPEHLHRGGTVARVDASYRAVLDAALSAPSGRGVLVDESGRFAGTVTANRVVAAMSRPAGASQGDPAGGEDGAGTGADGIPEASGGDPAGTAT
jgi:osmoprotectant transport system ATP-binding protein